MRTRLFAIVAAFLLCFALSPRAYAATHHATAVTASQTIPMFDSKAVAQSHCPSDEVVWLNTLSGIYHEKGMRWYGRTKCGAYVCRKEAVAAGEDDA